MGRVLITGCSTGIGRATALELAARGHEVVATARRPESLAELDVSMRLALDVDSDDSVACALEAAGELDVVVNNAGISVSGPVEKVPLDAAKQMFETNLWGPLRMIQGVLARWRERGSGIIVNVSSVAGLTGQPLGGLYCASKWALEALSESVHLEMDHYGIRVVVVEPGYFETAMSTNSRTFGVDDAPYDELEQIWSSAADRLGRAERPGPERVAIAIADAIEDDAAPLRHPVGDDATLVSAARASMDFEGFEDAMRATLDIEW